MSSLWDEIKDLFKTDKQLEQERQEKINSALEKEADVSKKLAELEKQYKDSLPKDEEIDFDKMFPTESGLKEIEYTPESDESIEKRAQSAIDSEKKKSQTKIKDMYSDAVAALDEDKESARQTLSDSYANLAKLYDELKEKANDDSIKRGMARSSVATNRIDALDQSHFQSATEAEKAYIGAVAKIDEEISKLQRDKDSALEQLDLKSASDLEESIAKLKSERDAQVEKYEKYNNDIRKKNESFQEDRQKKIDAYIADANEKKAEEEKQQQHAHANHDAECIEVDGDVRHQFGTVLYVAISEVRHVLLELTGKLGQALVIGICSLQLAILGKSRYGLASTLHLLLSRKFALSVGACVAIEYIVYARYITVERTCSKQRQPTRHSYAQRSLTALGIIGL